MYFLTDDIFFLYTSICGIFFEKKRFIELPVVTFFFYEFASLNSRDFRFHVSKIDKLPPIVRNNWGAWKLVDSRIDRQDTGGITNANFSSFSE